MDKPVRVAFVGAGNMAREHLKALLQDTAVEIVAFADVDKSKCAARIAEVQAIRPEAVVAAYDDAPQMLRSEHPDAAYVVVPPFGHGPAEIACIEMGIPFFIEKPVGLDIGVTRDIAQGVHEKGLLTCAGYMNRYREGVQKARQTLQQDPAVLLHGGWIGGSPGAGSWWIQKNLSGGQMIEQTTHTFDLVRYLGGEAAEVFAYAATGFNTGIPDYSIEDATAVNVHLQSGGVAVLLSCCAANGGGGGVWLSVFAKNTTFVFNGWEHSVQVLQGGKVAKEIPGEPDIFTIEDRAFIKAVRSGDKSSVLCSYPDAARTLALTLAADLSLRTGKPVAPESV